MTEDEVWVMRWARTGAVYGVYATWQTAESRRQWLRDQGCAYDEDLDIEPWTVQR